MPNQITFFIRVAIFLTMTSKIGLRSGRKHSHMHNIQELYQKFGTLLSNEVPHLIILSVLRCVSEHCSHTMCGVEGEE